MDPSHTAALQTLVRLSSDPLAVVEAPVGRILEVNPAWTHTLGWSTTALLTRRLDQLLHPDDLAATSASLTRLPDRVGADEPRIARLQTSDGAWREVRWCAERLSEGEQIALSLHPLGHERDLAARLREVERRFELAMTNAPIGMAISRLDGPWIAVNPALCDLLGYPEEDLLGGLTFADLTHPEDLVVERQLLEELLAGTRSDYRVDKRYRRRDGSVVRTETVVSLVRDQRGQPRYFVAQCLDTTQLHRTETELRLTAAELRESDAIRLAFLRATSHELRTPLTVVAGLTDTLSRHHRDLPDERVDELLARSRANADRLTRLITDLLDVDRLNAGLVRANMEPLELAQLISRALDDIDTAGRRVAAELQPITLTADATKIERIVVNLVANAIRHSPPDGRIVVRLERAPEGALLVVDDEGAGVPDGYEERIFEPFVQAPGRRDDASPGTGLGLTLVREFVRLHGGTVTAGRNRSGGASLQVRLPLWPDQGQATEGG